MKVDEKRDFLRKNYLGEWLKTRQMVEDKISNNICVCGKLATGFHERCCRKFHKKVDAETIKLMEHLLLNPKGVSNE